ncbi:hypothetical protein AVEN_275606-1 [Araneus ventricosus]|uniref:Uncharacterized protein n=1 Tax=Araneus ventricosus TaxID=182803 RepID=A0A4Y2RB42_ARAVE|nr:hypothetical protein AVEN_167497-1 [Araneus ventricosus]GBN73028.1 hypothetical protein AVEN_105121-1 [Araneus ventricosus]GBN76061.1 hypothetical protein AVEN_212279-1 [Araneus ventricosus]GBN76076.1 hypothetical protein AVEN_275606-1 [Araneus ventricosus]
MHGHGTFCGQTKSISISKVLSILKLQNMGKRESVPNATIASSFSKGHILMWCRFTAAFIDGTFFYGEIGPSGPLTCTVNGTLYESLLRN